MNILNPTMLGRSISHIELEFFSVEYSIRCWLCVYIMNTHFSYVDLLLQSIHLIYDLLFMVHSCVCYLLSFIF
jgi:hypothetical protein